VVHSSALYSTSRPAQALHRENKKGVSVCVRRLGVPVRGVRTRESSVFCVPFGGCNCRHVGCARALVRLKVPVRGVRTRAGRARAFLSLCVTGTAPYCDATPLLTTPEEFEGNVTLHSDRLNQLTASSHVCKNVPKRTRKITSCKILRLFLFREIVALNSIDVVPRRD